MEYRIKVFLGTYTGRPDYTVQSRNSWLPFWRSEGTFESEEKAKQAIKEVGGLKRYIYVDLPKLNKET